jgi:hypothetical protein
MSFFWLFIYIIFVIFVLSFFFWNVIILQRQKKSWQAFAKKHDLIYKKAGFFEASAVEGNYKKNRIGIFSEGRVDETTRGMVKYRTIIEVVLGHGMPGTGALGGVSGMKVIEALNFGPTFHPEHESWNKNHLITCSNRDFIKAYLTKKRLDRLNIFFNMPGAVALMVFDEQDAFLRIESADPMLDPNKITSLVDKLIALTEDLKLTEEELNEWTPSKI